MLSAAMGKGRVTNIIFVMSESYISPKMVTLTLLTTATQQNKKTSNGEFAMIKSERQGMRSLGNTKAIPANSMCIVGIRVNCQDDKNSERATHQ